MRQPSPAHPRSAPNGRITVHHLPGTLFPDAAALAVSAGGVPGHQRWSHKCSGGEYEYITPPEPEPEPELELEPEPELQPQPQPELEPDLKPEPEPELQPERKPQPAFMLQPMSQWTVTDVRQWVAELLHFFGVGPRPVHLPSWTWMATNWQI